MLRNSDDNWEIVSYLFFFIMIRVFWYDLNALTKLRVIRCNTYRIILFFDKQLKHVEKSLVSCYKTEKEHYPVKRFQLWRMTLDSDSGFSFLVIGENFTKSFSVENPINSEIILRTKKRNFRHNSCMNKRWKRPFK